MSHGDTEIGSSGKDWSDRVGRGEPAGGARLPARSFRVRKRRSVGRLGSPGLLDVGGVPASRPPTARRLRTPSSRDYDPRHVHGVPSQPLLLQPLPELQVSVSPCLRVHFDPSIPLDLPRFSDRAPSPAGAFTASRLSTARRLRALMNQNLGPHPIQEPPSGSLAPLPPSHLCASAPFRPITPLCASAPHPLPPRAPSPAGAFSASTPSTRTAHVLPPVARCVLAQGLRPLDAQIRMAPSGRPRMVRSRPTAPHRDRPQRWPLD